MTVQINKDPYAIGPERNPMQTDARALQIAILYGGLYSIHLPRLD